MAKINFNRDSFKTGQTIDITPNRPGGLSTPPMTMPRGGGAGTAAGAINPMVVIGLIDTALNAVSAICNCYREVVCERERTKQEQIIANVQITQAREATHQIQLHEEAETKRFAAQCEKELQLQKGELERFKAELTQKNTDRQLTHQEYMSALNMLKNSIDSIIQDKNRLFDSLGKDVGAEERRDIFLHLNQLNTQLVEISKQIMSHHRE